MVLTTILGVVGFIVLFAIVGDDLVQLFYWFKAKRAKLVLPKFMNMRPFGLGFAMDNIKHHHSDTALERFVELIRMAGRSTFGMVAQQRVLVFTQDPENIKALLATNFKDFDLGIRYNALSTFLGDGIFTLSGQGWKHSRAMLRPQFSREQVAHLDSLKVHVNNLINNVKTATANDEYIDIQVQFHRLTMDTATEFLFGESVNSLLNSQRLVNGVPASQFVEDYETSLKWSIMRLVVGPLYYIYNPKEYRDAVARARVFVEYFAKKALSEVAQEEAEAKEKGEEKSTEISYVFSRELAKVTKDPIVIRDQAFNILLAGRDTTASLLSYIVWYLAHDTERFHKLREGILEEFGYTTDEISFESLKRSVYLSWVINEVLRLHPIVPRNFRSSNRDTWLPRGGGPDESKPIFVPKDTQVIYSVYELHRNPAVWGPDADEFRPERWGEGHSHSWDYLPFNGGPRICLGQQFALTEVSFTIIRLVQTFDKIELRNLGEPLRNSVRLTSSILGGNWVKLHTDPKSQPTA